MQAQHSIGWYRDRLGNITGSRVGDIMKSGRKKEDIFGETAKTYLYQIAAERSMNPDLVDDDDMFNIYLEQVDVHTKAMQWGTDQEANARELYSNINDVYVEETGSCKHKEIAHFASSPDGIIYSVDNGIIEGCLEIKCPNQATFMRYKSEIHDNDSLLAVQPTYFYQCMSHMMCTGAKWTDFVVYCPFQKDPIHTVRITADETVFGKMRERIDLANEFIDNLI